MTPDIRTGLITCPGERLRVRHLVIGSGAGGSVSAWLTSQHQDGVLIVEEGTDISTLPAPHTQNQLMTGMWREGGVIPIESNTSFVFAEGRVVGGSTMVNAGVIHRLPESIRAAWEQDHRLECFTAHDFAPFCDEIEQRLAQPADQSSILAQRFEAGIRARGFSTTAPLASIDHTDGHAPSKRSMRSTYLLDAVRNGARIVSDCRIDRILFSHQRAIAAHGIHRHADGTQHPVVFEFDALTLAAGALQTPALLRRSGVRKHVGNTLKFHPTLRLLALFESDVHAWDTLMPTLQMKDLSPEISCGISLSLPPFLAAGLSYHWPSELTANDIPRLGMFYAMTVSHGNGFVRSLPFSSGYRVSYRLTTEDRSQLTNGLSILGKILFDAGAQKLYPSLRHVASFNTAHDLPPENGTPYPAKDMFAMSIHAFASCPMGETPTCPVDSYGRLKWMQNVRLADASILPGAPGVNPQGTIMSLVLRNQRLSP